MGMSCFVEPAEGTATGTGAASSLVSIDSFAGDGHPSVTPVDAKLLRVASACASESSGSASGGEVAERA